MKDDTLKMEDGRYVGCASTFFLCLIFQVFLFLFFFLFSLFQILPGFLLLPQKPVCVCIMQTLLSIITPRREITEAADVTECDFVGVSDPWRIADKGRPK